MLKFQQSISKIGIVPDSLVENFKEILAKSGIPDFWGYILSIS